MQPGQDSTEIKAGSAQSPDEFVVMQDAGSSQTAQQNALGGLSNSFDTAASTTDIDKIPERSSLRHPEGSAQESSQHQPASKPVDGPPKSATDDVSALQQSVPEISSLAERSARLQAARKKLAGVSSMGLSATSAIIPTQLEAKSLDRGAENLGTGTQNVMESRSTNDTAEQQQSGRVDAVRKKWSAPSASDLAAAERRKLFLAEASGGGSVRVQPPILADESAAPKGDQDKQVSVAVPPWKQMKKPTLSSLSANGRSQDANSNKAGERAFSQKRNEEENAATDSWIASGQPKGGTSSPAKSAQLSLAEKAAALREKRML
eukprot:SAG31_NODE_3478_length_4225_cov_1.670383_3_plen_320_part_00